MYYFQDPFFLRRNNAEILCGPVQLCHSLFGCSGFTTLSSPELLNCKPLSLLLHLKGLENSGDVKMSAFSGDAELPALNKKAEKVSCNIMTYTIFAAKDKIEWKPSILKLFVGLRMIYSLR